MISMSGDAPAAIFLAEGMSEGAASQLAAVQSIIVADTLTRRYCEKDG